MSSTRTILGTADNRRENLGHRVFRAISNPNSAIFFILIVLILITIISNPSFAEPSQFIRFLGRVAPIVIIAVGQFFVIITGEIDLSQGALVTTQVVISGSLIADDQDRVLPVILLMIGVGIFVGLINGLVTTLLKVPSLIGTLGMMLILSGIVFYWTGGSAGNNPVDNFRQIGRGGIQNVPVVEIIPYSVIILFVVLAIGVFLSCRPFGKGLVSIGGNARAAQLTGIRVQLGQCTSFIISSLSATVAGILLVGFAGVHPSVGQGYEFITVTAVVLGGVALAGGRGWVLSAAAGAIALETLFIVLNFLGISATYRDTVQGVLIISAVAVSQIDWGARRKREKVHEKGHLNGIEASITD